jgi:hypothetical protein
MGYLSAVLPAHEVMAAALADDPSRTRARQIDSVGADLMSTDVRWPQVACAHDACATGNGGNGSIASWVSKRRVRASKIWAARLSVLDI